MKVQKFEEFVFLLEKQDFFEKHEIKKLGNGLGFSEKEQKYYGWSHRAIYGFEIGHKVKMGDAGYFPSNKKDFIDSIKRFHKTSEIKEDKNGFWIINKKSKEFYDFPKKWGKGEYTIKTLEDAKQAAIDFAEDVS